MKKRSKIASIALLSSVMIAGALTSSVSFADDPAAIPGKMNAGTILQYDQDGQPVLVNKGTPSSGLTISEPELIPLEMTDSDERNNAIYEQQVQDILNEASGLSVVSLEDPKPEPGLKVIYDDEGYIRSYLPANPNSAAAFRSLPRGTRAKPDTYVYGAHKNSITITGRSSGNVLGVGRFTNFTDRTGESDNRLKKGDVATKGNIDNPKYGQVIDAKSKKTKKWVHMIKRDNGALPDAVLDVWKHGVEKFGYTWKSSLSFDGTYKYKF